MRSIIDDAFRNDGDAAGRNTRAIVVLHRGRLVAERYGPGFDDTTPQIGWSMSKSVLGMLIHAKLADERRAPMIRAIDWVAPQKRPSWLSAWQDDGRGAITLADLLFMRDGLKHEEGYAPWSAVPRMRWGGGDIAAYAGSAPMDAPPGQRFRYLSATANLLSGLLRLRFESDAAYWAYPSTAAFGRSGRPGLRCPALAAG